MVESHFLLIYSNAKEDERLWVKVEPSLQTVQRHCKEIPQLRGEIIFIAETLEDLSTKLLCCSGDIWVHPGRHKACVRVAFRRFEGCKAAFHMEKVWHRFPGRSPSQ